jgi:hypothetical protein
MFRENGAPNAHQVLIFWRGLRTVLDDISFRDTQVAVFLTQESIAERMKQETVLLKAGQHLRGHVVLDTSLFGGLKPGTYRIEAVLYGWNDKDFNEEQHSDLQKLPSPLLRGEVPASTRITLTR